MAFCRNCGKEVDDGAKFCSACGAPTAGRLKYDVPKERRVIVERRVVSSATYHEISFAGGMYHSRVSRIILYFATSGFLVFAGIFLYFASGASRLEMPRGRIFAFLLFLSVGMPGILYGIVYALTHIKKAFGKISGGTTLLELYKMQKFQISQVPVILFGFGVLIGCFFVPIGNVNSTFGSLAYAFNEPELVDLVLGYGTSAFIIVGFVYLIAYAVYLFALIYSTAKMRIIWRYYKGKIAPNAEKPKGSKSKKLLMNNSWLSTAIGPLYDAAVRPYVSVRFRDKNAGYGINSEPNYLKYIIFNIVKPAVFVIAVLILIIVYCAKVPPHLKQPVRPGKAAQVQIGYTHEQVKEILGEPSVKSTQYEYIYIWDNMDDIQRPDDLENAFDSDFSQAVITVYFYKYEQSENYFVNEVCYDTNYFSGTTFSDENIKKKITTGGEEYPNDRPKVDITLYKNGSMKIERSK